MPFGVYIDSNLTSMQNTILHKRNLFFTQTQFVLQCARQIIWSMHLYP